MTMSAVPTPDADDHKGAVEQDSRDQESNTTLNGQMQHRNPSPLANSLDTDFPEPGGSPEHSGQHDGDDQTKRERAIPEAEQQKQDAGQGQKHKQGDKKDDPQAA